MLLELICILGVCGIICLVFYKQAVQEFRILQTDSLEKAMAVVHERVPIVVYPAPQPAQLWTRQDIEQRALLQQLPVGGKPLSELIQNEAVTLPPKQASQLAEKVGLPVWTRQTILPTVKQSVWWGPLLRGRTEVSIGAQGLRQTYGYLTYIMATDGEILVSLCNESSDVYLPTNWKGKRLSKLTRDDAPLLGNIQYVDVIVRPGSALLVPPHWKVCWENADPKQASLGVWVEVHHPVSSFVQRIREPAK